MPERKYIRFINSDYKTLFHIPDSGRIRITRADGAETDRVCRFIDEYHTQVGHFTYHICEFAERMEQIGSTYAPLDYIRDLEFYRKHYFAADGNKRGPAYYILDENETCGLAYAPKGAAKGQRYCMFSQVPEYGGRFRIGEVVQWAGRLRELKGQGWDLDWKKIQAVTTRAKTHPEPAR